MDLNDGITIEARQFLRLVARALLDAAVLFALRFTFDLVTDFAVV
jgi:hypothetical protein